MAGATGIVLFVRHLQFIFSLAVALAVVSALRSVLETRRALFVGLAVVAFVPFNIHSLSYNTLGGGLFTAGCLLGFKCLLKPERRADRILAGLCHGLAVFVYPTLIVAVAACYLTRLMLARGPARRSTITYDLPALLLPLAGMGALIAWVGVHQFRSDYQSSRTSSVRKADLHKLVTVAAHEWNTLHTWYLLVAALLLLTLSWRRQRGVACLVLLALPLLVLPPTLGSYTSSLEYVAHYGWLALPLFIAVRQRPGAAQLLTACWLPGLLAGITTGYTSSNGAVNFGIGFLPAAIVTSVFLIWSLDAPGRRGLGSKLLSRLAVVPAVAVLALLLWMEVPVYRDGAVSTLRSRIETGAFAGLLTQSDKQAFLDQLRLDLAGVTKPCRIVFFDDFPAGYLLTDAQPDTNGAWITAHRDDALLRYYRDHGFPEVVVVMKRIPYAASSARIEHYRARDPLLAAVRAHPYRLVASRASYLIYRRSSTGCRQPPRSST